MITYLTDLEGRWDKLEQACEGSAWLSLRGDELVLAPGSSLVFGGDAIDRGPAGRRIVATLLRARRRYGDRVVLLAGNRDINKLRLHRELGGHPPERAPAEVRADPVALLRWIFANTMGAREAFAHRAAELAAKGRAADDEAVVRSFARDVAPGGALATYLAACTLAHRAGRTLFVHGAVTADSLGTVPGTAPIDDVDGWVAALDAFHADQVGAFAEQRVVDGVPGWSALVAYQAPIPGTLAHQGSVVYGRLADRHNDPRLPEASVLARLRAAGIDRLVVGHTPVGDVPAVLRRDGFTLVMADNSYGRLEHGTRVEIDEHRIAWWGRCRLDDGSEIEASATVEDEVGEVGRVTAEGRLVKARTPDGWLLFRALAERRVEQVVVADPGELSDVPHIIA
ncbi:MAG: hypothetical protein H6738_05550 [Alphaproteobacteria bacterium]|nr:hypothetical protein [Alphaproteobacteria bacterium]MCB9696233.1 hypothetical protein [Alphaproteobacteria bacterium]